MSTLGAYPVDAIIEAIAELEVTITPPAPYGTPYVWTDLTAQPGSWPAWLNLPDSRSAIVRSAGTRTSVIGIKVCLVFAAQEYNYASQAQRAWEAPILDAFDENLKLNDLVQLLEVVRVEYAPIEVYNIPYVALSFSLEATVSEGFTFQA